MRYARRRDSNDGIIGEALRAAGFTVHDFAGAGYVPDRLVTRSLPDGTQWVCWVEIKAPKGRITDTQQKFRLIFEGRGEFYIARDPQETVRELYERYIGAIKPELMR